MAIGRGQFSTQDSVLITKSSKSSSTKRSKLYIQLNVPAVPRTRTPPVCSGPDVSAERPELVDGHTTAGI